MSVIVVDSELKDSIQEYGQVIDSLRESSDFSSSLKSSFDFENNEVVNKDFAQKIVESTNASILTKLTDREFEPTFNLAIYILLQTEKTLSTDVIDNLIKCNPVTQPSLRDRKSIKTTSILSVLNNVFNLTPETSNLRAYVLEKILYVVQNSSLDFSFIQSTVGENLIQWLVASGASPDRVREIFWKFIQLDNKHSLRSLQLIRDFTKTYDLIELDQFIKFALSSETANVSFLVNNNVANALKENSESELVKLFVKYTNGELITSVPSGLPEDLIISKSRILALAKFFAENEEKNVFQYDEIPYCDSIEGLETLLIDSIKAGVVGGKLNQLEKSFYFTRVDRFILASNDNTVNKEKVKQVLINWKTALSNIDEIVNVSRENIVNNSSN